MMGGHGVEPFDLSLLFALWSLAVVAAEAPTGALADRVSRRRLLIVSRLVKGCCFLTWFVFPGFWAVWRIVRRRKSWAQARELPHRGLGEYEPKVAPADPRPPA